MKTKQQVIELAHGYPYNSSAQTFRGALRAIKHHGITVRVTPLPRDEEKWGSWYEHSPHRPDLVPVLELYRRMGYAIRIRGMAPNVDPREAWYATHHRQRLDVRMDRQAREIMDASGLLDRAQYTELAEAWLTVLDLPARDGVGEYARRKYGAQAVRLARGYHSRIHDLQPSKHASLTDIVYGGVQQEKRWDVYGKRYGFPCVYSTAGVTVELGDDFRPVAVLHPTRGNSIRLPLRMDTDYSHMALLGGDLYARTRTVLGATIITRYDARDKQSGISVRLPVPGEGMSGLTLSKKFPGTYYEHGATVAECRAEWERKRKLHEADRIKAAITRRQERKARLIARLCGRLTCTVADAREAGYCAAGIGGFRQRHGLAETATLAQLRATGDGRVNAIIMLAARRAAVAVRQEA